MKQGLGTYSATLGLGEDKVNNSNLDGVPDGEDDIGPPANLLHGDGPGELVEKTSSVDSQVGKGHTLGTHLKGKNLDRVEGLERSDTHGVESTKHEDHGQGSLGGGGVAVNGIALGIVADFRVLELIGGNGHSKPDDSAGGEGEEHKRATSDPIDHSGTENGPGKLLAVVDERNVGLLDGVGVPSGVEDGSEEVGEHSVASPLSEDGEDDVAAETVDGRAVTEKRTVIPPALVSTVHVEQLLVLVELELYPRGVLVAIAVVLGEDGLGLLLLAVDIQPSGRLGKPEAENGDETGEKGLEPGDQTPGVVAANVEGASSRSGRNDGSTKPKGVVHGCISTLS